MLKLFDLRGKVALVTGSSRGIGRSMAMNLAEAGAQVIVTSRDAAQSAAVAAEIAAAHGVRTFAIAANLADKSDTERLAREAIAQAGRVDILILNAGTNTHFGPAAAASEEAFDRMIDVNVRSVWRLTSLLAPQMAERKDGVIVIVSSIAGILGNPIIGLYGVSKSADIGLMRALAAEWGPSNIRVNAIAPGLIKTEFARVLWSDDKIRGAREAMTPLRRIGEPDDIGGIAVFLASRAGAFVTGQVLVADGGVTIV